MADAFVGVICKNTVDGASVNYNGTVFPTWSAEDIDTDGSHNTASNQSLITIPSALNGRYGIFSAYCQLNNFTTAWFVLSIQKNGNAIAWSGASQSGVPNVGYFSCHSPPMLLTTGDTYRVQPNVGGTFTVLEADNSCFTMFVVG